MADLKSSPGRRARSSRRAFSLIELLVVIGIIALLLAILLPILASARRAARATACMAALQQWGASFQVYVNDHRGRGVAQGPFLHMQLERGTPLFWWEVLRPGAALKETLRCPEAPEASNGTPISAMHAWGPERFWDGPDKIRGTYIGSYGFNAWLYASKDPAPTGSIRLPAKEASTIPLIFDCARWEVYPRDTDLPGLYDRGVTGSDGWMQLVAMERHRQGVNVVFLDYHVEYVPAPRLWKLKWSQDFKPRTVTLPR